MNDIPSWDDTTLSLETLERIGRICRAFEDAWRGGRRPRAEQYSAEVLETERPVLLWRLLPLDLAYRRLAGTYRTSSKKTNSDASAPASVARRP